MDQSLGHVLNKAYSNIYFTYKFIIDPEPLRTTCEDM